jgi:HJR/Mrr/RecB family endonuclease
MSGFLKLPNIEQLRNRIEEFKFEMEKRRQMRETEKMAREEAERYEREQFDNR